MAFVSIQGRGNRSKRRNFDSILLNSAQICRSFNFPLLCIVVVKDDMFLPSIREYSIFVDHKAPSILDIFYLLAEAAGEKVEPKHIRLSIGLRSAYCSS
jgi:hypothetical protein